MDEINIAENKIKVYTLLKSIDREGIDELIEWLNSTDYFTAPASSKYHLNVKGGLVAHSLSVYDTLKYLNLKYKLFEEDSLIVMGLLHDLCKVGYYKENVLKSGKVSEA